MRIAEDRLPPAARQVVSAARDAATAMDVRVALVGGAVRDLLLSYEVTDLDFAAEGNVSDFVDRLARGLGVEVHHHERFGTYRLLVQGLDPVDVVTARTESYARPGALPEVRAATLEEDLVRRDFPVNCMGWDLRSGAIIDPANGLADLAQRRLRVLHDRSFEDDPTRLLRLHRIAARYGFSVETETARLAIEAVSAGMLDRVSDERLRHELDLAIAERRPGPVFERFASGGLLTALFDLPRSASDHLDEIQGLARRQAASRDVALLAALLGEERCAGAERFWGAATGRRVCRVAREARWLERIAGRTASRLRLLGAVARTTREAAIVAEAALERGLLDLRSAWDRARIDSRVLDELALSGPQRGRALRKGRLAVAAGTDPEERGSQIARAQALKYLEPG